MGRSTVALRIAFWAVAGLMAASVVAPVLASNWGGPRTSDKHCNTDPKVSQCVSENYLQAIFIEPSVDADLREEIDWSMLNYTAVTDVEFYYWGLETCESCDVKVRAVDYGANGWWASGACESTGAPTVYGGSESPLPGTRWCRPQVFRYNLYYRASKYPTDNNERSVTCHELGHTLGLRHADSTTGDANWTESCMKNGNQTKITTTTHDRNHVNARY